MISPFIIFALPRSRTAWLSRFLSYSTRRCGHDISIECQSMSDFLGAFGSGGIDGTVESGAVLGWRVIKQFLPRVRFVTVRRPIGEVYESLAKFGLYPTAGELETKDELLDVVETLPGTLRFDYHELSDGEVAKRLFTHCLQLAFDEQWWRSWEQTIVQIDMPARLDRLRENYPRLQALKVELAELLASSPGLGLN